MAAIDRIMAAIAARNRAEIDRLMMEEAAEVILNFAIHGHYGIVEEIIEKAGLEATD